jgi:patatin-like phospholipase/acyl hydrolase
MAQSSDQTVAIREDAATNNELDTTGLCLLSLDGGGVRGLSSLYILKGLMTRLNYERQSVGLPQVKPCEIFDLIGGTSTGGYVQTDLNRKRSDSPPSVRAPRAKHLPSTPSNTWHFSWKPIVVHELI